MQFGILGPLQVIADGSEIAIPSAKQRALLAALLVNANSVVSSDRLIDSLWPAASPKSPRSSLRFHVSKLRDRLSLDPGADAGDIVVTRAPGYMIEVAMDELDSKHFEAMVEESRRLTKVDPRNGADLMSEALQLWRGPVLSEFEYEQFARETVLRLDEMRVSLVEDRLAARIDLGMNEAAIADLEALADRPGSQRALLEFSFGEGAGVAKQACS